MSLSGIFLDIAEKRKRETSRRQQDFDDLNHAMSGSETGRSRFLNMFMLKSSRLAKGGRSVADIIRDTLDWLLLNNPQYAAAHNRTMDTLSRAETATQTALDKALAALEEADNELQFLLERAARLPDGSAAFRDANGGVWSADGSRVDDQVAASINWRGDEPSYEDYLAGKKRAQDLATYVNELRDYQTNVLGGARKRLTDQTNPVPLDELPKIEDNLMRNAPAQIRDQLTEVESPRVTQDRTAGMGVPAI